MPAADVITFTTDHTVEDWTECTQTHKQTDRSENSISANITILFTQKASFVLATHLVVLFAAMFRARVHPNDQEFIPSMLISGLSLSEGWCCQTVTLAFVIFIFLATTAFQ